jgi:drug/metabolite transporter (DMT)-like permease
MPRFSLLNQETTLQVLLRYRGVSAFVEPPRRPMLLFRSFVGTVGISIQFYAMSKMVLTDAVVIIFTSPIITFLLVRFRR